MLPNFVRHSSQSGLGTLLEIDMRTANLYISEFRSFIEQMTRHVGVSVMCPTGRFIPGPVALGMDDQFLRRVSLVLVRALATGECEWPRTQPEVKTGPVL